MPLLATNQLQVVEGAISANLFNGVLQGLPVKVAMDTTSSPMGHFLMVRSDLKDQIKKVSDLKGRVVGVNAPNSIAAYEITKVLQSGGLDWKDIETKVIPFPQMGIAFTTKAIDVGLLITPYTAQFPEQKIAERWIDVDDVAKPYPLSISISMFNVDWANKNPKTVQDFYTAVILRGPRLLQRISWWIVAAGTTESSCNQRRCAERRNSRPPPLGSPQSRWAESARIF